MKRQILFRGKRSDNGEWIYGYLIGNNVIVGEIVLFEDEFFSTEFWYKVDPETVGMFTGMYDNTKWENAPEYHKVYAYNLSEINGTKPKDEWKGIMIFEGDIVRHTRKTANGIESTNDEVYFDTEMLEFGLKESNELFHCQFNDEFEVIGNIYESPELLKL